jgi:hypothetical protein
MNGLTWAAVAACLALVVSLCSVASFYFGRRKAATDDAQQQGSLLTDLQYIKETVRDNVKSVDSLSLKLDAQNAQREQEYRDMLVQSTELNVKYTLLSADVASMKKEIARYHHN